MKGRYDKRFNIKKLDPLYPLEEIPRNVPAIIDIPPNKTEKKKISLDLMKFYLKNR
jgi:hypothetical protein